ncbi:unnamed protein product [marine sediment metagenome]|uniref:Uncharacterized protein n=1 Tax=marine sediment metagenome TaxID=412755 RepID=X1B0Z4_9ZZZZ
MKYPRGSKLIYIDWLHTEALLISSISQFKQFIKINDVPEEMLSLADWLGWAGRAITISRDKDTLFMMVIRDSHSGVVAHESVHFADSIEKITLWNPNRQSSFSMYFISYPF